MADVNSAGFLTQSSVNTGLPTTPPTSDPDSYTQLMIVYNAIRQVQNGADRYLDVPSHVESKSYTISISDRGCSIDTKAGVIVPPSDTVRPFNTGMVFLVTNIGNAAITISQGTGVTLILAGTGAVGNKTLSAWGIASFRHLGSNVWICSGAGLA